MRKTLIALLAAASLGCANFTPYGQLSVHPTGFDKPEIDLSTTLGTAGFRYQGEDWGDVSLFCDHTSAVNQFEIGAGLNRCGVWFE